MKYKFLSEISLNRHGYYGIGASSCDYSEYLPEYLRITDISDDGKIPNKLETSIDINKYPKYHNFLLKDNDLVIARTGNSTGRNYMFLEHDRKMVFAGFLVKFSIDESIVNPRYVKYYFQSQSYKLQMLSLCTGSTRKNINAKQFENLLIPIIESNNQQHIVDTIGSVDDLIEKYKALSKRISEFKQFLFQFFSAKETELVEINSLVDFEGGAQPPKQQHIYAPKEGYVRFVQNRDYTDSSHLTYIPISKRNKICDEFDIMIDKYGEAGKTRWGISGAYNVALMKITPKETKYKEYIRDFLSQETIREILESSSQASTRASLNPGTFKGIKIPLLKKEDEVQEYQRIASMLQKYLVLIKNKIDVLQNLKETLLHKYFD